MQSQALAPFESKTAILFLAALWEMGSSALSLSLWMKETATIRLRQALLPRSGLTSQDKSARRQAGGNFLESPVTGAGNRAEISAAGHLPKSHFGQKGFPTVKVVCRSFNSKLAATPTPLRNTEPLLQSKE